MTVDPTATPEQLAAVQSTTAPLVAAPTATPVLPTAPPAPPPTATPLPPTAVSATTATIPAVGAAEGFAPDGRPALPPPPADGLSILVPDPNSYESPLFGEDPTELQVALTFDAGADAGYTADILDRLRDEGVIASFGMTGQFAEANPDLVRRMADEGHMLFNHTWNHDSLTGENTGAPPMTAAEVAEQLQSTEAVVMDLTGYDMKPFFRPPYGDYDAASLGYVADNGYYVTVYWTCDTRGWDGWDAAKITGYCTTNIKPHEIILLHVGAGAAGDYESLPSMIATFRELGYAFVTVEEMVAP